MNKVAFPVPVALLLRRILGLLSTASITHHYLLPHGAFERSGERSEQAGSWSWTALRGIHSFWWPNARVCHDGPSPETVGGDAILSDEGWSGAVIRALGIAFPWPHLHWPSAPKLSFFNRAEESSVDRVGIRDPEKHSPKKDTTPSPPTQPQDPQKQDTIHRLIQNPLLYDPVRTPRYPIVLCHGLYGFDVRGPSAFPSLRMHYWSSILNILRKTVGAEVIVTSVPGTGSIASRSEELNRFLEQKVRGRGVNLMAHSMGGLDCRHLITHVQPTDYTPLSLTSIATPHRGSAFMDWCTEYLGLGRAKTERDRKAAATAEREASQPAAMSSSPHSPSERSDPQSDPKQTSSPLSMSFSSLPSSFTTLLLSMFDSPAYANLTTTYLNTVFNPTTPDDPRVKYFSVAGRTSSMNVWHPLWLPKLVLDGQEERDRKRLQREATNVLGSVDDDAKYQRKAGDEGPPPWARNEHWGNDGLVSVQSARWGEFLGTLEGCDHWEMRGASGIEMGVDLPSVGEGWGLGDWGRFVRALGRLERRAAAKQEERGEKAAAQSLVRSAKEKDSDEALKSSTDRLSSVFDWLVDQVPKDSLPSLSFTSGPKAGVKTSETQPRKEVPKKRGDLETKLDLERFYVALTRKLYDEGL